MAGHSPCKILLIIATWLVFIVMLLFNGGPEIFKDTGIFLSDTGNMSDNYPIEITPAGWTFSIWGIIYIWQFAWLIYATVAMCRRSTDGPLYVTPNILPASLFFIYMFNNGLNIAWLILFDRDLPTYSAAILALMPFTLYVMLAISYLHLDKYASVMVQQGMTKDIWMVVGFLHNGLGIYAAWCTIATLLNFTIVLVYFVNMDHSTACTISLSVLAMELVIWFICDNFVLDRYTRYTVVPYLVVIWALGGSVAKNWDPLSRNSLFTVALLGAAGLAFVIKLIILVWRHKRTPLYTTGEKKLMPV